jgi:hypothetical protein
VHQKSITNNTTNNSSKTGLKRTNTQKILSPKSKIYKNYGYNKWNDKFLSFILLKLLLFAVLYLVNIYIFMCYVI